MTKTELIGELAELSGCTKKYATEMFENLLHIIKSNLVAGRHVDLAGFGKFDVHHMSQRKGVNPRTREPMTVPRKNKVRFKAHKGLKDAVNPK